MVADEPVDEAEVEVLAVDEPPLEDESDELLEEDEELSEEEELEDAVTGPLRESVR